MASTSTQNPMVSPNRFRVDRVNSSSLYGQSFTKYTHEALPKMDNYRDISDINAAQRPSIDELHDGDFQEKSVPNTEDILTSNTVKFGWIEGCLIRCLLNIWGVMLFLRLSWMVAHAGIAHSIIIISVSTVVTSITTLSMSAVSTNGEIKGGGIYFMISRSLGPEWGGAIGVVFSFANAGMAALNTVGFSESMISLLQTYGVRIVDGGQNDNRIISCVTICVLQAIIIIGMEWEAKAQIGLLLVLLVAMIDFFVGFFMGPKGNEDISKGWVGFSGEVFIDNLGPGYKISAGIQQDFFSIFSIFFPAVAGIQAGASISGDLKSPGEAIPKGTLLAIFITSASYVAFVVFAGTGVLREASGFSNEVMNGTFANCTGRHCQWGLYNDYQVMQLVSAFGPIIYAGCFAATLSSALSCLVSGPKTFQALCKDEVYPYLRKFGIGYGKSDDPYWSYVLGFIIAVIFILIADLNAIAPLISNFFMSAYALLNFCVFHATITKSPGWRPAFKYYNAWVSLIGCTLCIAVMFLMSWVTALITFACVLCLYLDVWYRDPELNWGTSTQANTFNSALNYIQDLNCVEEHVKNYRPQILVMSGMPGSRPPLIDFTYLLVKNLSLMVCGHVIKSTLSQKVKLAMERQACSWLLKHKKKGFYASIEDESFAHGSKSIIQICGLGKLRPNMVLMGYKGDWMNGNRQDLQEYFDVIHEALDMHLAVGILRTPEGLDYSNVIEDEDQSEQLQEILKDIEITRSQSETQLFQEGSSSDSSSPPGSPKVERKTLPENTANNQVASLSSNKKNRKHSFTTMYKGPGGAILPRHVISSITQFQRKQKKGTIDVWWLYDDGGLTILLPYILTTRKQYAGCTLRIFTLTNRKDELGREQRNMAALLSKFRIDYSDVIVIPDITKKAEDKTKREFESIIAEFKSDDNQDETTITELELLAMREKTNRHLRLRELLQLHSKDSNLVVMTLSIPRKNTVSAPLYMAWLEMITRDMPPVLLVRGNQTSVLTFYS